MPTTWFPTTSRPHCVLCPIIALFLAFPNVESFPLNLSRRSLLLSTVSATSAVSTSASTSPIMALSVDKGDADDAHSKNVTTTATPTIMTRNLRWGIIGLGDVTEKKSGPPFYKADGCSLVAVMRRTPGKAAAWVQQHVPPDMNHCHPGLDAVYVCTRPGTHLEIAQAVAQAGKILYVEKPVGRSAVETKAVADLTHLSKKPVYTAYISRAYHRTQALRQLLRQGLVGDCITRVQYTLIGTGGVRGMDPNGNDTLPWRLIASQAGGGLVMDVGCHIIDRIDYICGPLENVQGHAQNLNSPQQKVEDYVELHATIGNSDWATIPAQGAKVDCVWDFTGRTDEEKDELILEGPTGAVKMAGMSPFLPISVLDTQGNVVEEHSFPIPEHTAQELIQAITNEIRGVGSSVDFISRTDNAIRTARVLDTVLEGYYGSRDMGYWENEDEWPGRPKI